MNPPADGVADRLPGRVPGEPQRARSARWIAGDAATPAQAAAREKGQTLVVTVGGDWRLEDPTPDFDPLVGGWTGPQPVQVVEFEAAELGTWDSSLLSFLLEGLKYCEGHGLEFRDAGLPGDVGALLELVQAVPERDVELKEESRSPWLARLGERATAAYDAGLASTTFLGEVAQGFTRVATRRARMRWRDFWVVVQSNSSSALPIVTLISFLVGLIIAFLGAVVLRRFGAGYYVSYLVGYGMLREMAALMTGIIMAGRTGAAFAAELGSMKITEEIDAFETLGVSPVEHLVLPRVLGLFVMMPLLTIYSMFVGIVGGLLVSVTLLDLSAVQFIGGLLTPVTVGDGLLGVFKGLVFGLIIGIAGCMRGMQTGSDAGAVGRAATSAVVTGITLIILANAIIDWVSALLGV